jgi:hypothetical protein
MRKKKVGGSEVRTPIGEKKKRKQAFARLSL